MAPNTPTPVAAPNSGLTPFQLAVQGGSYDAQQSFIKAANSPTPAAAGTPAPAMLPTGGGSTPPQAPPQSRAVITSNAAVNTVNNASGELSNVQNGMMTQAATNQANNTPPTMEGYNVGTQETKGPGEIKMTNNITGQAYYAQPLNPPKTSVADALSAYMGTSGQASQASSSTTPSPTGDSGLGEFKAGVTNALNEADSAYGDFTRQLTDLKNGAIPLTPAEHALVDSTNASFDRMVQAQQIANKNLVGGTNVFNARTGTARYAPQIAQANVFAAVSTGLAKVSDIESQRVAAVAKLQEGFDDKNYKMIAASYDAYKSLSKQKLEGLTAIHDAIAKAEKEARDYNLEQMKMTQQAKIADQEHQDKLRQLDQSKYIVAEDVFGNPIAFNTRTGQFEGSASNSPGSSTNGVFADENNAWLDAYRNATRGNLLSAKDKKMGLGQLNEHLKNGDIDRAREMLTRNAIATLPAEEKKQAVGRMDAISHLAEIKTLLNTYVQATGDSNILTGSVEKALQKIGLSGNTQAAYIQGKMASALQNYRKDMTGVAFSPSEAAQYAKIFPDITNINNLNISRINSLIDSFRLSQETVLGSQIGDTNYDAIYPPPVYTDVQEYTQSHPEDVDRLGQMLKENPGWSSDDLLQIINSQ